MQTGIDDTPAPDIAATTKSQPISDREQAKLAALTDERQAIDDAERMQTILEDPLVAGAIARLGKKYYGAFLSAENRGQREDAWARGRALKDLAKELVSVIDYGRIAKHTRQQRQARERTAGRRAR